MSVRSASLLASATLLAWSATASAQDLENDAYALPPLESAGSYDGSWQGDWVDGETWRGMWQGTYTDLDGSTVEARYRGTFIGESEFVSEDGRYLVHAADEGWREDHAAQGEPVRHARRTMPGRPQQPQLAYSFSQREAWLADCRALYLNETYLADERRDRGGNGGLIGGVLGAVAGGITGNRIADGERLVGTLVGAGVGGLAGLAIGSLIGGSGRDRDREREAMLLRQEATVSEYCDAYLRRYEAGHHAGGYAGAYGAPMMLQAQPVMMVQMAPQRGSGGHRHDPECREIVREEWVDVPVSQPARPARRVAPPRPAPQPAKLLPVK